MTSNQRIFASVVAGGWIRAWNKADTGECRIENGHGGRANLESAGRRPRHDVAGFPEPGAQHPLAGAVSQPRALTTVRGKPITVDDVLLYLKTTGVFRNAIYQIISIEVVMLKARELRLSVSEEELHAYSKARRESMGLLEATAMNEYCKWLGITFDHWQKQIEIELLRQRLKKTLFPEARIREYFDAHRRELKTLSVSRMVLREAPPLEEFAAQIRAGKRDFSVLAREHSLEQKTRVAGGYLGRIRWGM